MADARALTPAEITDAAIRHGEKKAALVWWKQFLLGLSAGAFIAFASGGSTMAAFNLLADAETYGLGRCLAGAVFPVGMMLVVAAGGDLFTGNTLLGMAVLERRVRLSGLLRNWFWIYGGNFAGSLLIAHMMTVSGLFASGADMLGGMTIRIAAHKAGLNFWPAFCLGVMCNWLVCLAVWMSWGAKDMAGKLFAVFFPIWLFITSGFEHCVANMYYLPAGLFAMSDPAWLAAANLSEGALAELTWLNFLVGNLIPVTLGNVVGGLGFVGMLYRLIYGERSRA